MKQRIGYVSLVVRDYDEAIAFYTKALGSTSSPGETVLDTLIKAAR